MDRILHEKGPQRSLIRNKPTETLVNGCCCETTVSHDRRGNLPYQQKNLEVSTAPEAETQLVSGLQCGVETGEGHKVALSSAPQSPSVTSRSAVFMEEAALKPN